MNTPRIDSAIKKKNTVVLFFCSITLLVGCTERMKLALEDTGQKIKVAGGKLEDSWKKNRHKVEGCATAALGGGFAGYIIERSKTGVLVGAAVGCALGVKAAEKFKERRSKYAALEDFHAAELSDARQLNSKLTAENRHHESMQEKYASQIRALKRASSEKSAERTALKSKLKASISRARGFKDDALIEIAVKDELAKQLEDSNDFDRADQLRAESDRYQRKIDILSGIIDSYNRQTADIGGLI